MITVSIAGLLLPLCLMAAGAAAAADPVPTTTTIVVTGGDHRGDPVTMTATATSASGTPTGTFYLTGSGSTVAVPADENGSAGLTGTMSVDSMDFTAYFVGTNGYGKSNATVRSYTLDLVFFDPQPTLLRLGAGGLRLTLSFAAYLRDRDGAPMAGRDVRFTLYAPPPYPLDERPDRAQVVCDAVSDANGRATCGGNTSSAAIVSILAGGAWVAHMVPTVFGRSPYEIAKLPVVVVG